MAGSLDAKSLASLTIPCCSVASGRSGVNLLSVKTRCQTIHQRVGKGASPFGLLASSDGDGTQNLENSERPERALRYGTGAFVLPTEYPAKEHNPVPRTSTRVCTHQLMKPVLMSRLGYRACLPDCPSLGSAWLLPFLQLPGNLLVKSIRSSSGHRFLRRHPHQWRASDRVEE